MLFSNNLSRSKHVDFPRNKPCKVISVFNENRYNLATSVELTLYKSLFLPHMQHADLDCGSTGAVNKNKLRIQQNKARRATANATYSHPSSHPFEKYKRHIAYLFAETTRYVSRCCKKIMTNRMQLSCS